MRNQSWGRSVLSAKRDVEGFVTGADRRNLTNPPEIRFEVHLSLNRERRTSCPSLSYCRAPSMLITPPEKIGSCTTNILKNPPHRSWEESGSRKRTVQATENVFGDK